MKGAMSNSEICTDDKKYKRSIVLCLVLLMAYFSMNVWLLPYNNAVKAVTYRYGSSGSVVTQIQTKLKTGDITKAVLMVRMDMLLILQLKVFKAIMDFLLMEFVVMLH